MLINVNSFALGARSVDPSITTTVIFTGEWSMPVKEAEAANSLADQGIDVITCHVDGPKVIMETAERRGIFACGYHADQSKLAPKGYLTGAEWNWITVYKQFIADEQGGKPLPNFVRGGLAEGFIKMSPYGPGPERGRTQERRCGEGRDHEGRLLGLQRPDEGQQGQHGDPRRQGVPGNRGRTGIAELPRRGRERRDRLNRNRHERGHRHRRQPGCDGRPAATGLTSGADLLEALLAPLVALLAAVILFSIFLLALGQSPLDFLDLVWRGAFGSWFSLQNTLQRAAPLLLTALCVALPGQLGLVIIGGEAAVVLGGLAATVAALPLVHTNPFLVWARHGGGRRGDGRAVDRPDRLAARAARRE